MTESKLVEVKIDNIYPHPDNPRKDLGDLSELAESIKKNGIMQNLTIIPISALDKDPDEQPEAENISLISDFHALIGHRRLAAAKLAGVSKVPCKIVSKISKKEQVSIMLEENMQRNDLTILEQAQGFQMMLDLGETEETIAEKTGFSRSTIKHRLNLAQLNQRTLAEKECNDNFQLRLKDLYELEKLEDVKMRDKILKEATSSKDIIWKVQRAVKEAEEKKKTDQIIALLKKAEVKQAPKGADRYSSDWEVVKDITFNKPIPKKIELKQESTTLFYLKCWDGVCVIKKKDKKNKKETPESIRDRNKKKIKSILKEMNKYRKEFILCILEGKIEPVKDEEKTKDQILDVLLLSRAYVSVWEIQKLYTDKYEYQLTPEEKEELDRKVYAVSAIHKMLLIMNNAMSAIGDIYDWNGVYKPNIGDALLRGYEVLKKYGWSFENDEETKVLDGTHECYANKNGSR